MSDVHPSATEATRLSRVLHKASVPFVIFAAFLAGILALSTALFLPRLQQVPLQGSIMSVVALEQYERELEHSLTVLEQRRNALLEPERDVFYATIRADQTAYLPLSMVQQLLYETIDDDYVALTQFGYDRHAHTVRLSGAVYDSEEESAVALARMVDALEALDSVDYVGELSLVTQEDARHGTISPFTLTLFLSSF